MGNVLVKLFYFSDEADKDPSSHAISFPGYKERALRPTSHTKSYTETIRVKNIPEGVEDCRLRCYLEALTGELCQKIQITGSMAFVEMSKSIGKNSMCMCNKSILI